MGFLGTLFSVLFIVLVILTFISAPLVSTQYFKEMGKSLLKVGGWCKDAVVGMINLFQKEKTTTLNEEDKP